MTRDARLASADMLQSPTTALQMLLKTQDNERVVSEKSGDTSVVLRKISDLNRVIHNSF